ncbi:hypothetical protein TanjilG_04068 [Lupinus angustifolius]|uniref:RING-type E3 ubiquitin transferase n=2 Tax=Lupinus angustifolius TaxID=3871 RepID=A0A4P1RB70_LUPAN|nr:hypothetical protein TanjilG_04068 [Lupinus angustifolius]
MTLIISMVLLFGGVVLMVLLHVCITGRASRRESTGSVVENGANGSRSMSKDDLEKLPCYDYIAKDNTSSPVDCAVCLENLIVGDKCRLLPICKHSFHAQCVDTWLLKTPLCPICRSSADSSHNGNQFVSNNGYFVEQNSESREIQSSTESGTSLNVYVGIELRENVIIGSTNSGHRVVESRTHQIGTTENHMISATTLSHAVQVAVL